jgi:hypothetical protein
MRARRVVTLADGRPSADDRRDRTLPVHALTGADEEWLEEVEPDTPVAVVATDLLARCARLPREAVARLTVADRDRLARSVWWLSFGPRIEFVLTCPRADCGAPMDVDFELALEAPGGELRQQVHRAGEVRFRLPRGEDLEECASAAALLDRCLLDPADEATRAAVEAQIARLCSGLGDEMEATCPRCERAFAAPFDPLAAMLARIARRRRELDDDVHLLSLHYHWPLDTILALPRPRRRAYVELLLSHLEPAFT